MMGATTVYLSGLSAYHPEGRLTNDHLVATLDTSHEWLDTKIGIRERRAAADHETVAQMATTASRQALAAAGIEANDLDLIIGTASYDDFALPALGARVGNELGTSAYAFDVKAACSGWMVGIDTAAAYLGTGRAHRALVCAAEKSALGVDPLDRNSRPFFGDAAAAAIVQIERPPQGLEVIIVRRASDNAEHDAVEIPYAGWFRMDAGRTRIWVEKAIDTMARDLLAAGGLGAADLRALVCHQANLRLLERLATSLGVDPERHWHNVEWAGNTASAGAPTALAEGLHANRDHLADGDPILVITVGAGLNVIGALLRWVSD